MMSRIFLFMVLLFIVGLISDLRRCDCFALNSQAFFNFFLAEPEDSLSQLSWQTGFPACRGCNNRRDACLPRVAFADINHSHRFASLCRIATPALSSPMSSLQSEVEERGARIFDLVDRYPESIFSKAGFYQRMMALSMRDEH